MSKQEIVAAGKYGPDVDIANANFTELYNALRAMGWIAVSDGAYDVTPLSLTGGAAYVNLNNDAASVENNNAPPDGKVLFASNKIQGFEGAKISLTISFAVKQLTNADTKVTVVPNIGGAVNQITDYERDTTFTKGLNQTSRYLSSYAAYTKDTWEANGAQMEIKADQDCEISDVRFLISLDIPPEILLLA